MLIHIVCWKYRSDVDETARAEHRSKLMALTESIAEIERFDLGPDILHLDRSFDTGLVAEFADEAALDTYTNHPEHQNAAAFGREISQQVVSVDFWRY